MADQFIRNLTHDDKQFERQWSTIFDRINDLLIDCQEKNGDIPGYKIKTLHALIDYVVAEATKSVKPISTKFIFIQRVVGLCASDPQPSLVELVRIFRRILDLPNIFTEWHLALIKAIHFEFTLCEQLIVKPSVDLIESILNSLQKHSFLNGKSDKQSQSEWQDFLANHMFSWSMSVTNKLTSEETVVTMRPAFQQMFRYAVRLSSQSTVWLEVVESFQRSLPNLFDSSDDPADTLAVIECADASVSSHFLSSMAKSYKNNVQQFKANFPQILTTIEKLLLANRFRDARDFIDDTIEVHIHTGVDMDALLTMLIRVCPQIHVEHRNDFCHQVILSLSSTLENVKCAKKLAPRFFDLVLVILDLCTIAAPKCVLQVLEKHEFYPWKDLAPRFNHLIRSCVAYETIDEEASYGQLDALDDMLQLIVERANVYTMIIPATHSEAQQAVLRWCASKTSSKWELWPPHVYNMGKTMIQLIDQRQVTVDYCLQLVEALRKKMVNNDEDSSPQIEAFYTAVASSLATYIIQLKTLPEKFHQQLASFIQDALAQPLKRENGDMSYEQQMAKTIWFIIGECLSSETDARPYQLCLKRIHSLACDINEEEFFEWWWTFWNATYQKIPSMASSYVEEFLSDFLDRQQLEVFQVLSTLYFKNPKPFHRRLNELLNKLSTSDTSYTMSLAHLISIVVKEHPELLTSAQVDLLFTLIKSRPSNSHDLYYLFQILEYVATVQPHLFHKHRKQLLYCVVEQKCVPAFSCLQQYFVASTIIGGETTANECLTILIDLLQPNKKMTHDIRKHIFHACKLIGLIRKAALETKRSYFIAFQSETECRVLLDYIDGKKLNADNQEAISQAQREIAKIEKQVIKTDKDVQHVSKVVRRQETKMVHLDARVNTVGTRLNDVTERIDIQQQDIERIDAKTLSYVPSEWGSQVCQLLNHSADNDWRLLGKRFGYSTSELRHWSLQADPSMALLNEWFMTHKANEATYGLVKMLDAIGRQDVSSIIRKAVAKAGDLIPDDMPFEIKRLPPVFLSYQWNTQKAVSILKGHLEEAGYACWMDIGQMGGGDKLFAKIDAGIRGAKVIICCMNGAYAESDNCLREVHLAISTGKPIIPLQMEKQKWPPEGALGPIMSEYLYIRFYDRQNNTADYWPGDKFPELLGQIRYHVAPDLDMIRPRYKDWFAPKVDHLIFLQPTAPAGQNKQVTLNDNTPLDVTHPQVMISYQWDRQTDIIALYKRLTQLGYRCWLDIFQMGGGDSLFEKIDTGIRNAKCILACVTPNYTKSINCRREMSLSDALKKTIVPLLFEDTGTWPPVGPMALVFTDKSYIDLRQVSRNAPATDMWSSKEFDEILVRLQQAVPEVQSVTSARSKGVITSPIAKQNIGSSNTSSSATCCLL